jgi:hypothetical protein
MKIIFVFLVTTRNKKNEKKKGNFHNLNLLLLTGTSTNLTAPGLPTTVNPALMKM